MPWRRMPLDSASSAGNWNSRDPRPSNCDCDSDHNLPDAVHGFFRVRIHALVRIASRPALAMADHLRRIRVPCDGDRCWRMVVCPATHSTARWDLPGMWIQPSGQHHRHLPGMRSRSVVSGIAVARLRPCAQTDPRDFQPSRCRSATSRSDRGRKRSRCRAVR